MNVHARFNHKMANLSMIYQTFSLFEDKRIHECIDRSSQLKSKDLIIISFTLDPQKNS